MSEHGEQPIIVVRRISHGEEGHHGGAWKIAFADFMTAMMALFLVLWLINATNEKTKASIARYFNPVKLADMSVARKGAHDPKEASPDAPEDVLRPAIEEKGKQKSKGRGEGETGETKGDKAPLAPSASMTTREVADLPSDNADEFRDPFQDGAESPAKAATPPVAPKLPAQAAAAQSPASPPALQMPSEKAEMPVDGKAPDGPTIAPVKPSLPAGNQQDAAAVSRIAAQLATNPGDRNSPAVEVESSKEGLLIRLTDKSDVAMFSRGASAPSAATVAMIAKVAKVLSSRKGSIIVRGHTDGAIYRSRTYDNWKLSGARAQTARDLLLKAGVADDRFERIEGYADRMLRVPGKPEAPENRRIEILLRGSPE